MTDFLVYDVFTREAFGGNQLAVVPDATTLAESDLQRVAREFNFSETTFVFPPDKPDHTAKVRIFTPTNEIPFAGHPTIGTAIAIAEGTGLTKPILELGVGPISCNVEPGNPSSASFTSRVPLEIIVELPLDLAAATVGLQTSDISIANHVPTIASVGLPFTLIELESGTALEYAQADLGSFRQAEAEYANDIDLFATFLYVREGNQINARMFAPLNNIPEDPATGSAVAALAAFLTEIEAQPLTLEFWQGVAMGRPSFIQAASEISSGKSSAVTISGSAVLTMRGKLML